MVDLSTTYLGLKLKNPLVASASPLSEKVETVKKLEEAGIAAIVMYSLFEEQIIHESLELDHFLFYGSEISAEIDSFYPKSGKYTLKAEAYIETLKKIKQAVNIPVIGSLNGVSTGGWIKYARKIEDAGADALELNLYYLPTDPAHDCQCRLKRITSILSTMCAKASKFPWRSNSAHSSPPSPTLPSGWSKPAQMVWCSSTVSTSPISTWKPWKSPRTWF